MKYLNSVNESQFLPLEKILRNNKTNSKALKLITLKISPEQERNIRYTDEKFEFNPTPSKHPLIVTKTPHEYIRVTYKYIRVTYEYIRVHTSNIRVHTSNIRVHTRYIYTSNIRV